MSIDHGVLSGIRRTSTPRQRRQEAAALDRTIDAAVAEVRAHEEAERQAAIARYKALTAPVPFTPEELAAALVVRTSTGWHKVVRVNTKSVTVATPYSWTDRYPIDKILEVKS